MKYIIVFTIALLCVALFSTSVFAEEKSKGKHVEEREQISSLLNSLVDTLRKELEAKQRAVEVALQGWNDAKEAYAQAVKEKEDAIRAAQEARAELERREKAVEDAEINKAKREEDKKEAEQYYRELLRKQKLMQETAAKEKGIVDLIVQKMGKLN